MPMDFPDMSSLKRAAKDHQFRQPEEEEEVAKYRKELADHVVSRDRIESGEIRFGIGWDKWSDDQNRQMLFGALESK